ncbi:unnamed protein product [Mytilus edulis]|uniref:Uncharacterized protein n=1 Tax=Mytilus edulis TaxID=6550 RepID=A0A8S3RJC7_MYTED|nr:unnamed protein product [Mytilus edulis]
MDTAMQAKYENAMKGIENLKLRYEKEPIKMFWGESFDRSLMNLRSLLKDTKREGRHKVRVQIIFQTEDDIESNVDVLNSLKEEINEGLSGIDLIVATKGSLVLNVDILLEILETDDKLFKTLALFLEKILARSTVLYTEAIDIVLYTVEENTPQDKPRIIGESVYLEFDIEANLLETDDKMVEQLGKISDVILKHSNKSGTNKNISVTLLPINLENISAQQAFAHAEKYEENITPIEEAFTKAQTAVKYNIHVSATLRKQLNLKELWENIVQPMSCLKIGNTLVFVDIFNRQLKICYSDSTVIRQFCLHFTPRYITEIDSSTVAVSCDEMTILIMNISSGSVIRTFNIDAFCWGISYHDNNLYVVMDESIIQVMDLTGKVIRTIPKPSGCIHDITVDRNRIVCIDVTSIYCCSLDGDHKWKFKKEKYHDFGRVTTDNEGYVYVTDKSTNTVVVVSHDGKLFKQLLSQSDGLNGPSGIHFHKQDNILFLCNYREKAFLFDVRVHKKLKRI